MSQLTFEWPKETSYSNLDFIISGANAEATEFIDSWPKGYSSYAALLTGPPASGKTHLAHRWQAHHQAIFIDSFKLGTTPSVELWPNTSYAIIENIHLLHNEDALFHLLRHAESHNLFLLLTSTVPVPSLPFSLPDLKSRLSSFPVASISPPDDLLLRSFLIKCFSDRQLRVNDEVIFYILRRMERSFIAIRTIVDKIESSSLETGKGITIPMIKSLIEIS
jgi:chromosomal replication initiation ATPase DnaA